jgi:excisionase family DNA binding protein
MTELDPLLSIGEVCTALGGCHRATVYRLVADGSLPPPVKIGAKSTWPQSEVEAFVEARKAPIAECIKESMHPRASDPTCLYRHFDADGALLYVGVSLSAIARLCQHRAESGWFGRITTVTLQWFPNRSQALAAETAAIRSEHPLHNVMGCTQ